MWVMAPVRCPAFRRSGPAKAGTPNGRFLESIHAIRRAHWDHEPTPNPSQEGNWHDADECLFPSWEGSGVGRFMEELSDGRERKGDWISPQPPNSFHLLSDAMDSTR